MASFYECVLCNENFSNERAPKILDCGHTYCALCLKQTVVKGKQTCPECRAPFPLDEAGVDGLTTNVCVLEQALRLQLQTDEMDTKDMVDSLLHEGLYQLRTLISERVNTLSKESALEALQKCTEEKTIANMRLEWNKSQGEVVKQFENAMDFVMSPLKELAEQTKKQEQTTKELVQRIEASLSACTAGESKSVEEKLEMIERAKETELPFHPLSLNRTPARLRHQISLNAHLEISSNDGGLGVTFEKQKRVIFEERASVVVSCPMGTTDTTVSSQQFPLLGDNDSVVRQARELQKNRQTAYAQQPWAGAVVLKTAWVDKFCIGRKTATIETFSTDAAGIRHCEEFSYFDSEAFRMLKPVLGTSGKLVLTARYVENCWYWIDETKQRKCFVNVGIFPHKGRHFGAFFNLSVSLRDALWSIRQEEYSKLTHKLHSTAWELDLKDSVKVCDWEKRAHIIDVDRGCGARALYIDRC